jgi:hypothetical protein
MSSTPVISAQNTASDILRMLLSELDVNRSDALATAVFKASTSPRWHLQNNEEALDILWTGIRESEDLTDFIIRGTSLFLMHESTVSELITTVSDSLGWVASAAIVDSAITDRSGTPQWFEAVFTQSPWLLFLYMLSTIRHV